MGPFAFWTSFCDLEREGVESGKTKEREVDSFFEGVRMGLYLLGMIATAGLSLFSAVSLIKKS